MSASNELFQADFARTPRVWCASCHAPGVSATRVRFGRVDERHGVRCTTCHVDDKGVILTSRAPSEEGTKAHPMRQMPSLSDERACASCHEFARPNEAVLLQETISEWRSSRAAARGVTCQGCHMRDGSHLFSGPHDRELLMRSFEVRVSRRAPTEIEARVTAPGVAHRAPTGDLSRALRVQLCEDEACARVVRVLELARSFSVDEGVLVLRDDTTVPTDGERVLEADDGGRARFYVAEYVYAPQLVGELPDELVRVTIARGRVISPR